jgi:oxygen-independent coproporphyrinogen-3 oxidase
MNSPDKAGLYVHVPFCLSKCPYCDFYSVPSLDLVPDWKEALFKELALHNGGCPEFDSLYLGGGTPSALDGPQLADLVGRLFRDLRFTPDAEITIEANPDDITREKLRLYRGLGVNRISLGVQSLREDELRLLGRRHTAEQAESALGMIRECGFTNLSVDLMYGLPGQAPAEWMATLERAIGHRPEHLSCYQLTFHANTDFGRMLAQGKITEKGEEDQRTFFMKTAETLQASGYIHYEISNFAKDEESVARHNGKYWRRVPYLGLGPGAHSFRGETRWWNASSVSRYCEMLKTGTLPIEGSERLTEEQQRLESLSLGLRTREGVDLSLLRTRPGSDKTLSRLECEGLVEVCEGRVVPTTEGYAVADSLPLLFM